ncbi:MAG: RNA polymerase sigma-70 factor [Bacteroidia bacterium]|nr:RNA polymerase sigma-70 factor [Bacteroidia bacterium]
MAQQATSDQQLWAAIQNSEREALNQLFRRYYDVLVRYASVILRDTPEIEEAVSDVFLNMWQKAPHLEVPLNVKAYLYASVRHEALRRAHQLRSPLAASLDAVRHQPVADEPLGLEYKELEATIAGAIEKLPVRCREVFVLSRFHQMKHKDISKLCDVSEKTIESHISRALADIRSAIAKYFSEPTFRV